MPDNLKKIGAFCVAAVLLPLAAGIGISLFTTVTGDLKLQAEEVEFSGSPKVVFKRIVDGKQEIVFVVQPQGWQPSGIEVEQGDEIVFDADGRINISLNGIIRHIEQRNTIERRILDELEKGTVKVRPDSSRLPERYFTPEDMEQLALVRDWTGPSGYPGSAGLQDHRYSGRTDNKVLPREPYGALLATIHSRSTDPVRDDKFSGAFIVGESYRMIANKSGTLWFTINDVLDDADPIFPNKFYIDNLGYFLVKITVEKVD